MKRLIVTALVCICYTVFSHAQENTSRPDFYLSAGLSVSNTRDTSFAYSSYPSLEAGFMKGNFSLGLVVGRSNLSGFKQDITRNYWYELKGALYVPVGKFNAYGLAGIGNYLSTSQFFIEYGIGASYAFNKFGVYAQASNWDGTWYVTPGVSYTF